MQEQLLTVPYNFFGLWRKKNNAICLSGSVSTIHDVFFTHLEAIENLMNIEFPGVSWQSTGSFMISFLQNCLFIIVLFF